MAIRATSESECSIRFVKDGKALLVAEQNGGELVLTVIDLAIGILGPMSEEDAASFVRG